MHTCLTYTGWFCIACNKDNDRVLLQKSSQKLPTNILSQPLFVGEIWQHCAAMRYQSTINVWVEITCDLLMGPLLPRLSGASYLHFYRKNSLKYWRIYLYYWQHYKLQAREQSTARRALAFDSSGCDNNTTYAWNLSVYQECLASQGSVMH
jgi:hypothetical protein